MGYNSWIGFAEESTWASEVSRTKFLQLLKGSDSLAVEEEPWLSEKAGDIGYDADTDFYQGNISAGGGLGFEVPIEGAELIFKHALGQCTTTTPDATNAPTVRQHVFSLTDALQSGKGLSIEVDRSAANFIYTGMKITQLQLQCAVNAALKCNLTLIGKDGVEEASPSTPSFPAFRPFHMSEATFKWNANAVGISDGTWTLNNNLDGTRRDTSSGRYIKEPVRGSGKIEAAFSVTAEFDSMTHFDDFRAATQRALQMKFEGDTIAGAYKYTFQLDIAVGRILRYAPVVNDEGKITVAIEGRGFRTSVYDELGITMINTVTSV